jgi:hypothetical protein
LAEPLIIWADENICVLCTIRHFSGNRKIKAPLAALTDWMVAMLYYSAMCKGFVKSFDLSWIPPKNVN